MLTKKPKLAINTVRIKVQQIGPDGEYAKGTGRAFTVYDTTAEEVTVLIMRAIAKNGRAK